VLTLAASSAARIAGACDVCAVYIATEAQERRNGFRISVAEQYTRFDTRRLDGAEIANPGEHENSAITQVVFGYQFTPRVGLQLNLPLISRTFQRLEDGKLRHGDETGVGDLSLLANVLLVSNVTENSVFRAAALGGLKLPSGDPSRLREELSEGPESDNLNTVSGLHGHDLALGSGSVDGIVGGQIFWSWRRLFLAAAGQWSIRTEGDIGYQYADDVTWLTGPGGYLLLEHDYSLSFQAVFSGETKGKDSLRGVPADDTGMTALYLGPSFGFTWGSSLNADIGADLPVLQNNTALQLVPDYRLRGGVTWRF
jgi:hypothetical protein